ncbi:MAG: FAD-binding protein [Candidatus Cryptobacteroides sp.]|nr:FAD-binding protein [Candidatus Cryptobacteroides sp.]
MIQRIHNYDLSTRNTFRMRVRCALYVEVTEEADLPALDWDSLPQPVLVMGGGSNLLFTRDFPGTVLHVAAEGSIPGGHVHPRTWVGGGARCDSSGRGRSERSERSSSGDTSFYDVTIPAGVVFDEFCAWAAEEGLWGPENLSLIPGEVGASAVQNIGAYGVEAKDIIASIRAYDRTTGQFVTIDPATCAYGYRTSKFKTEWKGRYVITAVTYRLSRTPQPRLDYGGVRKALEEMGVSMEAQTASASLRPLPTLNASDDAAVGPSLLHGRGWPWVCAPTLTPTLVREAIIGIRRQKLPAVEELGSAGSFFCNPVISREHFHRIEAIARADNGPDYQVPHFEVGDQIKVPAAWMIEQCGFKGAVNGGAQVYQKQPLVIVNASGSATPEEIIGLEQQIIKTIEQKYGITLHPEVEHV